MTPNAQSVLEGDWEVVSPGLKKTKVGTLRITLTDYKFKYVDGYIEEKKYLKFVPYLNQKAAALNISYSKAGTNAVHISFPDTGTGTNSFVLRINEEENLATLEPNFSAIPGVNSPYVIEKKLDKSN